MTEGETEYRELPDGWWKGIDWLKSHEKEPTLEELIYGFITGRVVIAPEALDVASKIPPRVIVLRTEHPKRGTEALTMMFAPVSIRAGEPDAEPDLTLTFKYYDLARSMIGELDIMAAIWGGRAEFIGNITAAMDLKDILDLSTGKERGKRVPAWPVGAP